MGMPRGTQAVALKPCGSDHCYLFALALSHLSVSLTLAWNSHHDIYHDLTSSQEFGLPSVASAPPLPTLLP